MGQREFTVDTRQLERLSGALAALPRDVNAALVSSLRSAALKSLRTTVAKYYALDLKKLSGTYRISRRAVSSADGTSVAYEIYGRRLTPAHFVIDPMRHRAVRPTLEIIRGHLRRQSHPRGQQGGQLPTERFSGRRRKNRHRQAEAALLPEGIGAADARARNGGRRGADRAAQRF